MILINDAKLQLDNGRTSPNTMYAATALRAFTQMPRYARHFAYTWPLGAPSRVLSF